MLKIVLIGAGNVGYHLGKKLAPVPEVKVVQVFSRTKAKAKLVAQATDSQAINKLKKVTPKADLYILAVRDDAIVEVAKSLSFLKKKCVVHTSGATPTTVLAPYFKRYGSFYPLQTFSIKKEPNWATIPICYDAKKKKDKQLLANLAAQLSDNSYPINDSQRSILHVAAVYVNNFSNLQYLIAEKILEKENISLEILKPLLLETAQKVQHLSPSLAQTGPAIRGDQKTIKKHKQYLKQYPAFEEIYQLLTKEIQRLLH